MKFYVFIAVFLFSSYTFGAPCNGAPGSVHSNPDGSIGGYVQNTAKVSRDTFVDSTSEICDKVITIGAVKIQYGSRIHENVIIEGSVIIQDSYIYGDAKLQGRVVVQQSEICQASLIKGIKVINSRYYCQTEDPQPKDPGETGQGTLLGVDSDGDGVRDDIEIFINKVLSNTPSRNYREERVTSKIYAKILQKELLLKSNTFYLKQLFEERLNLGYCFNLQIQEEIFLEMYDTKERVIALTKVAGAMHGEDSQDFKKKCKSLSAFDRFVSKFPGSFKKRRF